MIEIFRSFPESTLVIELDKGYMYTNHNGNILISVGDHNIEINMYDVRNLSLLSEEELDCIISTHAQMFTQWHIMEKID